ncbi:DNA polymerase epsilon catalytic subunit A [Trifolium repens]|nr:DNA polymerase epsilon catalytic subunit A [Trifolium repens]
MGSLMAGWDSHTTDPKSTSLQRNRSLTNEEIDAFWKSKKDTEEEHLKAISNLSKTIQPGKYEDTVSLSRRMKKDHVDKNMEHLVKKNGWWTKSNWAFLNEPPVMEAPTNKYASQFHIANLGSTTTTEKGFNIGPI